MRLSSILSEALRDLVSGTSRTIVYFLVAGTLLTLPLLADATATTRLVEGAREYRTSGASIMTVSAPDGIDGAACDALTDASNVQASGAIKDTGDDIVIAQLPRSPVDLFRVTEGFASVLAAPTSARGVLLSADVIDAVGSDYLMTSLGSVPVSGDFAYPADGRRSGLGWAGLAPEPEPAEGRFDECWVDAWPSTDELRSLLFTSVSASASPDVKVSISQLNGRFGSAFHGFQMHQGRITRWAPALACALAFSLSFLAVRLRRLEFAARLHDGATHRSVRMLNLVETLAWLVPSCMIALAASALAVSELDAADASSIFGTQLGSVGCALVGGVFGGLVAVMRIHERHLFAYFKDR